MVVGADTPRVSLFADGTIIRLEPRSETAAARLMVAQLTPAELAAVRTALRPNDGFWRLESRYRVAEMTDMKTTELVVYDGKRFKDVSVYGYTPEQPAGVRQPPAEVDRICKLLVSLKPRNAVPWTPRWLEVIVWPYEHSPEAPLPWPSKWPTLKSRMAFTQANISSIILPGSEEQALREFLARRGERQAIGIGGKKWTAVYRPVMPGGRVAQAIAARLAK
jgi:hypothetical protein